jgi:hypothetical protein
MRIDIERVTCEQTELVSGRQLWRFLANINTIKRKGDEKWGEMKN